MKEDLTQFQVSELTLEGELAKSISTKVFDNDTDARHYFNDRVLYGHYNGFARYNTYQYLRRVHDDKYERILVEPSCNNILRVNINDDGQFIMFCQIDK